jgi:hypothetical protein
MSRPHKNKAINKIYPAKKSRDEMDQGTLTKKKLNAERIPTITDRDRSSNLYQRKIGNKALTTMPKKAKKRTRATVGSAK